MKMLLYSFLLATLVLSACGTDTPQEENTAQGTEDEKEEAEVAAVPEVEVITDEEPLPVSEETTIQAKVTQDGAPVDDAEYVDFEIWNEKDGQDSSNTIESEHVGDGVYEIQYTFEKKGTYQMYAHTQVGDLHTMPKVTVQVGEMKEDKTTAESGHDHKEGHGDSEFMVHLMTEQTFTAGEDNELVTHINRMEQPFEEAKVRFEISSDQLEAHKYIETEETNPGEYTSTFSFPSAGTYTVNVHYEKPDKEIHGHKEVKIEVK
ncbi:FixH family protein [Halobacillus salinus]|uniref:YtkA-like domain-containing protein n=1 Tax=Halobacillus salinus TaxID=192814 RepID=A0A4Z0H3F5_9BACI|nr:FixH family protein [Halobacillus salinus]TGB03961.1 hypothetical protein E4663_02845 [Halobacillus salinus]